MQRTHCGILALAICAGVALWALRPRGTDGQEPKALPAPLGIRLGDWTLPRSDDGRPWSLARDGRDAKAVVVLFLGTECPLNNRYLPTVVALQKKYGPRGVLFVGINSNAQDDRAAVARYGKEFGLPFVVLKDEEAKVADRFAAARTPEAFVLDATYTARYRGRIDDRYDKGIQRPQATRQDLAEALDAVLAGKEVARPVTEAAGCPIARPPQTVPQAGGAPVTYSRQVARLLQDHCQECHRPGEAGPFSLSTYQDAADWSAAVREAVAERRMPPWHADPAYGRFRNARRLSDADRATLLAWVDQGCPEGDRADLPPPREFVRGWRIGKPDAVFTMPEAFQVPAQAPKGGVPYQFLLVTEPFPEEKWVQAVECRPTATPVVHHITAYLVEPGADLSHWKRQSDLAQLMTSYSDDCFLGGYGLNEEPLILPPGQAKHIPKGSRIAFELHYQPNGTACTDRSYVGLVYAKEPPVHHVRTGSAMQPLLAIPPGVANSRQVAARTFKRPAMLLSLTPHMHLRGKSATFTLIRPDGSREVLLSVPRYDFNWQTNYELAEPVPVPKGSTIEYAAYYDNSADNPNNPDPRKLVFWGEQSWDEMMIGFFEYYWADDARGR
jgi:thiol-disulfide isomerase/thioredoxin/mono/diheme cytochrome c family protein